MNNKNIKKHRVVKSNSANKIILLSGLVGSLFSQSYAQYEIQKHSINSGGSKISGGSFELKASIGQNAIGSKLTAQNYELNSGYWQENTDLILKSHFE